MIAQNRDLSKKPTEQKQDNTQYRASLIRNVENRLIYSRSEVLRARARRSGDLSLSPGLRDKVWKQTVVMVHNAAKLMSPKGTLKKV